MREFNAILGSCTVSRTAQSFFESELEDADLSCSVLDAWALEEAEVYFGQSLETCPEVPQKRHSLLSRWHCCSACHLSRVSSKGWEWTSSGQKRSHCSG